MGIDDDPEAGSNITLAVCSEIPNQAKLQAP
jgi:hypothetical protein